MKVTDLAAETVGLAGAGLVSYGAWLVFEPAGFIVGGVFLLAAAWLLGASAPPSAPDEGGG